MGVTSWIGAKSSSFDFLDSADKRGWYLFSEENVIQREL